MTSEKTIGLQGGRAEVGWGGGRELSGGGARAGVGGAESNYEEEKCSHLSRWLRGMCASLFMANARN